MATTSVQAVVLAAGRAKRFNTATSKLLATICGQEMVLYSTQALTELQIPTTVVIGYQGDQVKSVVERFHGVDNINFVAQERQDGTGHAVLCTRPHWHQEHILVLNGDMPLVTPDIINSLCETHQKTNATVSLVIAHNTESSGAYGRIVKDGSTLKIVEAKEFSGNINDYPYINAGIYIFKRSFIEQQLPTLEKNKLSGELYITDLIAIASAQKDIIATVTVPFDRVRGINTLKELWTAEQIKRSDIMTYWMLNGVRFTMPHTCHLDVSVRIGAGSIIDGGVSLLDNTVIGQHCHIQNNCLITNATIEDDVQIRACSVIENTHLKVGAKVGPFAHVHTNSIIGEQSVIGNFVEIKQSIVGSSNKIKHLSYIGDTTTGKQVNVGAGSITCNFDGEQKHETTIKDGAFIGSNSIIIAPISIGNNAWTAAGSVVTEDVPDEALAIARSRQINKEGYGGQRHHKKQGTTVSQKGYNESNIEP